MINVILLSMLAGMYTMACNLIAGSPLSHRACMAAGSTATFLVGAFIVWKW